jgi:transcription antitermination factor NusG
MTLLLAYAAREFDAQEEAEALGITCYVPRRVDMIRSGKRRRPDPVITAAWPRYLFADVTEEEWHWLKDSKHIRSIMWVNDREAQVIRKQANAIERAFEQRMRQIEAGERLSQYEPGALLDIVGGQFAGNIVTFTRMVERADQMFPFIEAEMQMMNRSVRVMLDPLYVQKAAE